MGRIRQLLGLEERAPAYTEHPMEEFIQESLGKLELALEDRGWDQLGSWGDRELTRDGMLKAAHLSRVMNMANPLIKRGLNIRKGYVWGGGVSVSARDEELNEVVQQFWEDPSNKVSLTGNQAQDELETALGTDGTVALACFTNPRTGRVQVRALPYDQITDLVQNPEDQDDIWYVQRRYRATSISPSGVLSETEKVVYYPTLTYRPTVRPRRLTVGNDSGEVMWDAPVHLLRVNRQMGWKFGVGDAYAALPWARSYRDFLADWATLVKALSQFAWKATAANNGQADSLRQKLARAGQPQPANPGTVGATAVMTPDVNLEAIPKTGATIDSESGKPLAGMVAAALGVPVTMLLADPGQTGARAVAETLDKPTIEEMDQRRSIWTEAFQAIIGYVLLQSVKAPQGALSGTVNRDSYSGMEEVVIGDADPTIEVTWPDLEETDVSVLVKAVVDADSTGKMPPVEVAKLLLHALDVQGVDEIINGMTDADGNWLDPYRQVGDAVGNAAVAAYRRGEDPAAAVAGEE